MKRKRGAIVPWQEDQRLRFVYFVRDKVTDKIIYVGQTLNTRGRWKAHARSDSQCTLLRQYLARTVHAPSFELCDAFEQGVRGERDAWAVESYYIALHNTTYNMHTNPDGCNCTVGSGMSDPTLKQRVEGWLRDGYSRAPPIAVPSAAEASSFGVAMLEDAVGGASPNPVLLNALVEARTAMASVNSDDLRSGIAALAKGISPETRWRDVSYLRACQDFFEPIERRIENLRETHHDDAQPPELPLICVQLRRSKLHFKEGNVSYGFLKKQLEALTELLPTLKREPTRAGTVRAIKARCRPGWRGLPTVEAAIEHTTKRRDNPPPIVGAWTEDELQWFERQIADMHSVAPAGRA